MSQIQTLPLSLIVAPYEKVERYRRFNNSLVHFRDDVYLMTYRLFYPTNSSKSKKIKLESRKWHPWSSSWKSYVDETVVAVLQWRDGRFHILREMRLDYPARFDNFKNNLQDGRILKLEKKFYIYGQAWVESDMPIALDIKKEAGKTAHVTQCLKQDSCAAVVVLFAEIQFDLDEKKLPRAVNVKNVRIPCVSRPEVNRIHNDMAVEKNWCFFEAQGKTWFQYMMHPHIVISLDCKTKYETPSPLQALKAHVKCGSFWSPGGPLTQWKSGQLLGCGHIKYKYDCVDLLAVTKDKYLHPQGWGGFIYVMFFYVIENRPPFRMLSYSHGYIPEYKGQHYALVFPMGCIPMAHDKQKWAISMGNGDDVSNIMTVDRADIEKKLISVDAQEAVEKYTLSWWKVNKI